MEMQKVIVRTLKNNKLSVAINFFDQKSNFNRLYSETLGLFISRLSNRLSGVDSVKILNDNGVAVSFDKPLSEVLVNNYVLQINDSLNFPIFLDPPSIDSVSINSPELQLGFILCGKAKVTNLDSKYLKYSWESRKENEWTEFSSSPSIVIDKNLLGCEIRLKCSAEGVAAEYSDPIGPISEDTSISVLLNRALPLVHADSVRFMGYNILADCYLESKNVPKTNFFPYCPKEFQCRSYREPRIVAEIVAHDPDVLCLQEVEEKTYRETLHPLLPNYNGQITVIKGRFKVGCAMFYKKLAFSEVHYESFPIPDMYSESSHLPELPDLGGKLNDSFPNIMKDIRIRPVMTQIIVLRHKKGGKLLIVGNTHLFWDPRYHVIALLHVHALCSKMAHLRDSYREQGEVGVSAVLCGDLNSQTDSLVHQYLTGKQFNLENKSLCDFLATHVVNPLSLQLARGDPHFTNYTADFKSVIDYLMCDNQSTVAQVTPSHPLEFLEQSEGCPSQIFPSDHLPIISDIILDDRK